MQGLVLGDLTIDVDEPAADRLALIWKGMSNSRDPDKGVRSFFGLALAEASTKSQTLEMHFEQLTHFNSSTIAALLRFIEEARTRKVKLALYYDGSLRWRAHSFEPLSALVRDDGLLQIHKVGSLSPSEKIQH